MLCREVPESALISTLDNPFPLASVHRMLVWRRHVCVPSESSVEEWECFWAAATERSDLLGFANLGAHSGASQPHLHAQMVSCPDDGKWHEAGIGCAEHQCALCTNRLPLLGQCSDVAWFAVPGGYSGELVVCPLGHTCRAPDPLVMARVTHGIWQAFAAQGWSSGTMTWHASRHWHAHFMPSISAPAALEISMGVPVDRLGQRALERIVATYLPAD